MAIIVEGPDNSGKTTLCKLLSKELHMPVFHAGGPPASNDIALKLCREQMEFLSHNVILDRVTPISRQVYENRFADPDLTDHLKRMLNAPMCTVIYCRPPNERLMDMKNHQIKDHDTPEHMAYVLENLHNFIELYDRLMSGIPHIEYDWTADINIPVFIKMIYKTQILPGFYRKVAIGG